MPITPDELIDLVNSDLLSPPSLWGDGLLVPKSRMVLAAPAKSMKSFSAIHLAMSLATGKEFWGFTTPRKLKVLMVQMELPREEIKKRAIDILTLKVFAPTEFDRNLHIYSDSKFKITNPTHLDGLRLWMMEHPTDVVLFDPLYRLHDKDENSSQQMQYVFSLLDTLIGQFGVALVLIHHYGKPGEFKNLGADRMRGSSALAGWADTLVYMWFNDKHEGMDEFKVEFETRFREAPEPLIVMVKPGPTFVAGTSHKEIKDQDILQWVRDAGEGGIRPSSLETKATLFGYSRGAMYRWLKEMEGRGVITREPRGGHTVILLTPPK